MTLIVDASVAIKWNVIEVGSAAALDLFRRGREIVAPDLLAPELANALWKKRMRGELAPDQASAALAATLRGYSELAQSAPLAPRALELAAALKHPAYDCFYLALAERRGGAFVTADARLLARLAQGGWAGAVEAL